MPAEEAGKPISACNKRIRRVKRSHSKHSSGVMQLIDNALRQPITIIENGRRTKIIVFEAILKQLLIKEMKGDQRAMKVRLKYMNFVTPKGHEQDTLLRFHYQK